MYINTAQIEATITLVEEGSSINIDGKTLRALRTRELATESVGKTGAKPTPLAKACYAFYLHGVKP